MRRTGRTGLLMEQTLFGVERGQLLGCSIAWTQRPSGTNQGLKLSLSWENRRPSDVSLYLPDDQQISHYAALFMPVVMNGAWMHRVRLSCAVRDALDRASRDGAEITERGTRLVRL